MIRTYFHPDHTFRTTPARAYNTNPNLIIPLDSSPYIDLVDDTNPDYTGSNFSQLVDHARTFFHDVTFRCNNNVHPWVDLVEELINRQHGVGGGGGGGDGDDDDGGDDESKFSDDEDDPEVYRKKQLNELKKKETVISQGLNLSRWIGGHLQKMRSTLSSLRYSISKYACMYESQDLDVPPMLGYDYLPVDAPITYDMEFKGWGEHDQYVSISLLSLLVFAKCC
jgi:hypothetical protein